MREKTCCFTGHRELPTGWRRWRLAVKLEQAIIEQTKSGTQTFVAGGALGFDMLVAQTVLKLKKMYPDIRLTLALPCLTQTRGWPVEKIEEYEQIKALADKVIYTSQNYTKGCMFKRNRYLVDRSSVCICYLTKDSGGTAYTVKYAKTRGLEIINLASED